MKNIVVQENVLEDYLLLNEQRMRQIQMVVNP